MKMIDVEAELSRQGGPALQVVSGTSHRQIYLPLRLEGLWRVKINEKGLTTREELEETDDKLLANEFYLATSMEKLKLSWGIFGLISTKSKLARQGIDCLGSSSFISPGFGQSVPTPIVLEVSAKIDTPRPHKGEILAHAVFLEIGFETRPFDSDHHKRFPFVE